jgi:hypothetical protein
MCLRYTFKSKRTYLRYISEWMEFILLQSGREAVHFYVTVQDQDPVDGNLNHRDSML